MDAAPGPRPPDAPPPASAVDPRLVAGLLALTLAAYANTFLNGFAFDDRFVLVGNGAVHTLADPARFFTDPSTSATVGGLVSYRPLRTLVYASIHHLFGLDPLPYHVVNVAFHLANTGLVLALLLALSVPPGRALVLAGLFGVHPIQTEAVASVTGLTDVMFGFFYLASLLQLTRALAEPVRARAAALCWLAFVFALASKEMALSLPLVAALVALRLGLRSAARQRRVFASRLVGALALTAFAWLALRWRLVGQVGYDAELPGGTALRSVWMQAEAVATYVRLLLLPAGLSCRHVIDVPLSGWEPRVVASVLVVAALVAWLVVSIRRRGDEALGLAWFCLTLVPVMNLVPLPGDLLGERFLYVPMLGFLLALVALAGRWGGRVPPLLARSTAAVVLLVLATATAVRNRDWKDDLSLFESAVRVSPTSNVVRRQLTAEYLRRGRRRDAMEQIEAIRRNARGYVARYLTLGDRARERQDLGEARLWYRWALRASPGDPEVLRRISDLEARAGRPAP